jgi:ribosomal protein S18
MKKQFRSALIGAVAILLMLPNSSLAKGLKFGLKIGLNAADHYGENIREVESLLDEKVKSKLAYCAGGYVTFEINTRVNMQLEILYSKKGSKIVEERIVTYLDYLEIPVLIKFLLTSRGRIKPNLFAGPAFSVSLDGKTKEDSAVREWENLKGTDFGLIIGGGLGFAPEFLGRGEFNIDLRYNLGLITISNLENEDVKNRVISISVGYSF